MKTSSPIPGISPSLRSRGPQAALIAALAGACGLLAIAPAVAVADTALPDRKAGLWEIRNEGVSGRMSGAEPMRQCSSPEADARARTLKSPGIDCDEPTVRRDGDAYVQTTVCRTRGSSISNESRVVFDGDKAYRMKVHTKIDPPLTQGVAEREMSSEAKWVGPCPKDMEPGDTVLPNGMKFNPLTAPQAAPPAGAAPKR